MALSLLSLNINWHKQFNTVEPYLRSVRPDIALLQEVLEHDVPYLQECLGMEYALLAQTMNMPTDAGLVPENNVILARYPLFDTRVEQYAGTEGELAEYVHDPASWGTGLEKGMLLVASTTKDNTNYRIATTHFSWTPKGISTPRQQADMERMLSLLQNESSLVFAGDFNAPRGGATFSMLTERYKDNIPPEYATSMDASLHRIGIENAHELADKMVDGLFTTSDYIAKDVSLVYGVSDHAAIVATIEKTA